MAEATGKRGHGDKQERQQEQLIAALLTEPSYERAAKVCGLSKATVCRRMQDDGFKAAFRTARREVVEATIGRLQQVSTEAVETLREALKCDAPNVRVSAARSLLEYAIRGVEWLDIEERLAAVERRYAENRSER